MNRKMIVVSLVLIPLLLASCATGGQQTQGQARPTARELTIGTPLSGYISSGGIEWFGIRMTETDSLTVETTGNIDTYLQAFDEYSNRMASDDDSGEGHNARLQINAQAGRIYFFRVSGYDESSGSFDIVAQSAAQQRLQQVQEVIDLPLNTVITGDQSTREEDWYSLKSPGDGPLTVELSGGSGRQVEVYDEFRNPIAQNNYALIRMNTQADRTYLFRVSRVNSYTIIAKAPLQAPAEQQAPQAVGQIVQGSNLNDKEAWMNAFAQSNTRYILELNANESGSLNLSYSGKSGITVTLRGVGVNRTINGSLTVGSGNTIILDNNITVNSVQVAAGGTLIMYKGSTITAGVSVGGTFDNGGTFTMNGGAISAMEIAG